MTRLPGEADSRSMMKSQRYKVLIEFDDDAEAWVTYVPSLEGISTFGATREEALDNTRELILGYLEAAAKEGIDVPVRSGEPELIDLEVAAA